MNKKKAARFYYRAAFLHDAPGRAHSLEGESHLRPRQGESLAGTARVSTAKWNPEEAAGKTLVRRTETASEAARLDEKAIIFKVRCLHGKL
jgi:hypothetical protein